MELFSLEDDDARELFITQTPSQNKGGAELAGLLGDPLDFTTPCKSLIGDGIVKYSDISDDDDIVIPCSQNRQAPSETTDR